MFSMFFNGAEVDYDVINVDVRKRAAGSKKIIHGTLKSTRCIAQPEGHDFELIIPWDGYHGTVLTLALILVGVTDGKVLWWTRKRIWRCVGLVMTAGLMTRSV